MTSDWTDRLLAWLPEWPLVAAAVAGLLALLVLTRIIRRTGMRRVAVAVAATVGVVTSAETMWLVAGQLGASGPWRLIPAVLFESAMIATAARAREKFNRDGSVGKFGPRMWMFALGAGSVAALVGGPMAIILMRFLAPLVAAAVVLDEFTDHDEKLELITLKVGFRRLLVRWGLAEAGARDLNAVERDHRIHRLVLAADRLHHGWPWLQRLHRSRLRRLARYADDAMVAEVQTRVQRIHLIEVATAPRAAKTAEDLHVAVPTTPLPTNGTRLNGAAVLVGANGHQAAEARPAARPKRHPGAGPTAQQVAAYVAKHPGKNYDQVAAALGVSKATVNRRLKEAKETAGE